MTSLKQTCYEYLIKFSENQSAPKLEKRKTSPCVPNLLRVLVSRILGYHNLCSPDYHHVHYATSKYVYTSNVGSTKWLMASCPRHRALRIVNVYTLYMLQRFRFPPSGCCLVHFTLEIVFSTVLLYCCAVLCDESHNLFTLNIAINKSIQVSTPTRSLLMLIYHLEMALPGWQKFGLGRKF